MRALRSHGVTLIELLVVVAILGIVAATAIPYLSSANPQQLDAAAQAFADTIRFARSESLRTGVPHGYAVDTAQQRIRVFRADLSTSPPGAVYDVRHPVSKKPYTIDLRTDPRFPVDTISGGATYQGNCNSTGETVFDVHGRPYCRNPYPVFFRQGSLTLQLGGLRRVVTLDGVAGRVTVQ